MLTAASAKEDANPEFCHAVLVWLGAGFASIAGMVPEGLAPQAWGFSLRMLCAILTSTSMESIFYARTDSPAGPLLLALSDRGLLKLEFDRGQRTDGTNPVSYTHLTLPTICSV